MNDFTEQIREAIRNCGVTPYVLSRDAGISSSVLSRFLNGSGGLTLKTLDALARVLGWEIIQTVQRTSLPQKRGRQRKEVAMKTASKAAVGAAVKQANSGLKKVSKSNVEKATQEVLNQEAENYARSAHDDHFPSRRGIWNIGSPFRMCVYNNNPYRDPDQRPLETSIFLEKLKALGIKQVAYAEYGAPQGKGKYSYAMIIDATAKQEADVEQAMREAMYEASPDARTEINTAAMVEAIKKIQR